MTTHRAPWWVSPVVRRACVDLAVITLLFGVGVQAFGPVFGSYAGYLAAGMGGLLGLVVSLLAKWRSWSPLGTLLAGLIGYLLVGGPLLLPDTTIGGIVPSVETLQQLTLLSWQSWRDLLTVALPAGEFDGPGVMPFLSALVTMSLSASAALQLRALRWVIPGVLLPLLVFLILGILWGSSDAPLAFVQGAGFVMIALCWTSWRQQLGDVEAHAIFVGRRVHPSASRAGQLVAGAGTAGLAIALVGGSWLALGAPDRVVLREQVVPPLELSSYPSPLTKFRQLETAEDKTLFTVSGLPAGVRIRLAAMDLYDGNVYRVTEGSAAFVHSGRTIIPAEESPGDPITMHIEVGDYEGVWLPGGGDLRHVEFTGPGAEEQQLGLFHNASTGTALTTAGVSSGTRYSLQLVPTPTYTPEERERIPVEARPDFDYAMPSTGMVQVEAVSAVVDEFAGENPEPLAQLVSVEETLREQGYFANGIQDPAFPGHTITRLDKYFLREREIGGMIGDDEQFAVTMALMARELGVPARVVMGFYPTATAASTAAGRPLAITGKEAHVWVEVKFEKYGWVNFDPVPTQSPQHANEQPRDRSEPQVLPPPEVPEERDPRLPPPTDTEDFREEREEPTSMVEKVVRYVGYAVGIGLLLLGPLLLILLLKSRRRRRRRRAPRLADRISGGWSEIVDLAVDVGIAVPRDATRHETALLMDARIPHRSGASLAQVVDANVFGVPDPTETDVMAVWAAVADVRKEFRASATLRDRLRMKFSTRSLRRRNPERRPVPDAARHLSQAAQVAP